MIATSIRPTLNTFLIDKLVSYMTFRPSSALLNNPFVHLFTTGTPPVNPNMEPADFVEASFSGYGAAPAVSSGVAVNLSANQGLGKAMLATFAADSGITPPGQTILGYWVQNSSGNVYLAEQFPAPINFVFPYDFLQLVVVIPFPYLQQA